tara:strand:- start:85 stop:615 length:531 start_codon:yes stop_codon:yes gene_type:complete
MVKAQMKNQNKKAQMKIQQMAFMIVAVFFFFILVGLFFLKVQFSGIQKSSAELEKEQAISSLKVIANMQELNCNSRESLCLDKDKIKIMSGELKELYETFWQIASIKVYLLDTGQTEIISCPALNCNYFEIFDNQQNSSEEYSTYISVCEKIRELGYVYDNCEIAKLVVGRKINEK